VVGVAPSRGFGKTNGQTLHSTLYDSRESRLDLNCNGVIRVAYVRQVLRGRQTWVRIGEYCDGCSSFWPGARRESLRSIDRRRSKERAQALADDEAGYERRSDLEDLR
jgi:hypothetical protein